MSAALAIFVKTPGYSPIKTRLAADCGQAFAEQWHQRAAAAVASVAAEFSAHTGAATYWAVAESAAIEAGSWQDFPTLTQGQGDLGQRLACVYSALQRRHGAVLLIGADSPQLTAELLVKAWDWLQAPLQRCVIGPSVDGGFWLAGANCPLPDQLWIDVHYSGRETGHDMRCALASHAACLTLPRLRDVDTVEDLEPVLNSLQALPAATTAQLQLAHWMRERGDKATVQPASSADSTDVAAAISADST